MKKIVCCIFALILSCICFVCLSAVQAESVITDNKAVTSQKEGLDPYYGGLHAIHELNCEDGELDSHADECDISTLEIDFRRSYKINNEQFINDGCLWYPRIKKLSNGRYILFFQDGRWGPNVYYTRSDDGISWDRIGPHSFLSPI